MPVTDAPEPNASRQRPRLTFSILDGSFAVCQLPPDAVIPQWALTGSPSCITRAQDELSIVCRADNVPADVTSQAGWICLKLEGPFPFSLTGILASILDPLAAARVPIFAISTFNTDYVLIQQEFAAVALEALRLAGHELRPGKGPGVI